MSDDLSIPFTEEDLVSLNGTSIAYLIYTALGKSSDSQHAVNRLREFNNFMIEEKIKAAKEIYIKKTPEIIKYIEEICGENPLDVSEGYEFMEPPEYLIDEELKSRFEETIQEIKEGSFKAKLFTYKILKEKYDEQPKHTATLFPSGKEPIEVPVYYGTKPRITRQDMQLLAYTLYALKVLEWDDEEVLDSITEEMKTEVEESLGLPIP